MKVLKSFQVRETLRIELSQMGVTENTTESATSSSWSVEPLVGSPTTPIKTDIWPLQPVVGLSTTDLVSNTNLSQTSVDSHSFNTL